jgi:hypothetical protein
MGLVVIERDDVCRVRFRYRDCRGRQHHQHRTGWKFHMSPNGRRDIIAGLAVSDNSHFLDDRRREFALFRELAATAISSPARGVAMSPPSALSVRSICASDVRRSVVQAIFCRRRHQPRRPPPAKINSVLKRVGYSPLLLVGYISCFIYPTAPPRPPRKRPNWPSP